MGPRERRPWPTRLHRLRARHGRPASCCPARRAPLPPGGHCKFDIAALVVFEWHCFLLLPGDVVDCPLGCVAVDASLLTRGPSFGVDRGVGQLAGVSTLALLPNPVAALAGPPEAAARPVDRVIAPI